jgi:hypothetical protein
MEAGEAKYCDRIYDVVPQRDRSDFHEMRHLVYLSSEG